MPSFACSTASIHIHTRRVNPCFHKARLRYVAELRRATSARVIVRCSSDWIGLGGVFRPPAEVWSHWCPLLSGKLPHDASHPDWLIWRLNSGSHVLSGDLPHNTPCPDWLIWRLNIDAYCPVQRTPTSCISSRLAGSEAQALIVQRALVTPWFMWEATSLTQRQS